MFSVFSVPFLITESTQFPFMTFTEHCAQVLMDGHILNSYLSQLRTCHYVCKFGIRFLHVRDIIFIYTEFYLLFLPTIIQYCRLMMLLLISIILLADMLLLSADCVTHFSIHPLFRYVQKQLLHSVW